MLFISVRRYAMLLPRLCLYLLLNWRHKSIHIENTTYSEFLHVIRCLLKKRYTFYRRRWSIRDPSKPEKFLPIGALEPVIVDAMASLLSLEMESFYRRFSREYRVARGGMSFYRSFSLWPEMGLLVKVTLVLKRSEIDHNLLGKSLREHLGVVNSAFIDFK